MTPVVRKKYPTELTDAQWVYFGTHNPARARRRPSSRDRCSGRSQRDLLPASLRLFLADVPKDFPPFQTVYEYYRNWRRSGVIELIHDTLRTKVRASTARTHNRRRVDRQPIGEDNRRVRRAWLRCGEENQGSQTSSVGGYFGFNLGGRCSFGWDSRS